MKVGKRVRFKVTVCEEVAKLTGKPVSEVLLAEGTVRRVQVIGDRHAFVTVQWDDGGNATVKAERLEVDYRKYATNPMGRASDSYSQVGERHWE